MGTLLRRGHRYSFGLIVLMWGRVALATPELVSPDPRGTGLGGAGVASADDASATHHNPARLQAIGNASFVLGISGLFAHQEAPAFAPNVRANSDVFAPFGMIGGAVRLTPKLVIGLSLLPGSASGGRYELPNGTELSATILSFEGQLAASYAILENLWLGVEYRASYLSQTIKVPAMRDGQPFQAKTSLDSFHFFGVSAGLYYEPIRGTGIGFAYRSQISGEVSGTSETPNGKFDARSEFANPDKFTLGIAQKLADDRLLLTAQAALVMSPWVDKSTTTTLQTPMGPAESTTVTNDRTFWEAKFGGEYWLPAQPIALRAGVGLGNENVRAGYVSPFSSSPGDFVVSPTVGAGVKLGKWKIDGAGWYQFGHGDHVDRSENGNPGEYRRRGVVGMFSLRYAG